MKAVVTWLVLLLLGACANRTVIDVDGFTVYEAIWQKVVTELGARAADELACPADKLHFTLLSMQHRHPTQVSVEGCEKRASFTRVVGAYAEAPGPWQRDASDASQRGDTTAPAH